MEGDGIFRELAQVVHIDDLADDRATQGPPGTMLLTASSFVLHCGKCGRLWAMPTEVPDFEARQANIIEQFKAHECDYVSANDSGSIHDALTYCRLALVSLDLGEVGECKTILSNLIGRLVENGAIDAVYTDG